MRRKALAWLLSLPFMPLGWCFGHLRLSGEALKGSKHPQGAAGWPESCPAGCLTPRKSGESQQLIVHLCLWYFGTAGATGVEIPKQKEAVALAWFLCAGHCACACRCGNMIRLGSSLKQSCTNEIFRSPYFRPKSLSAKPDKVKLNVRP